MYLVLALLILCFYYFYKRFSTQTPLNLPPGPKPWPLVGNVFQMDAKAPHLTVDKWGKQYGDVFSIYLGSQLVIVLNSWGVFKEAMTGGQAKTFSGRHKSPLLEKVFGGRFDLAFADGPKWKVQRRQFLTILKDLGMGRATMEHRITDELSKMVDEIKEKIDRKENIFELSDRIEMASANVIHAVTIGKTWTADEPEFLEYMHRKHVLDETFSTAMFSDFLPWIKYMPPDGFGYFKLVKAFKETRYFVTKLARQQFDKIDTSVPTVVTEYLNRWRDEKENTKAEYFSEARLFASLTNLYVAGQDTVAATQKWLLLFLIGNPHVQDKMRREIQNEIGDRKVSWEDRKRLHYVNAVINEAQRMGNIVPWSLLHSTLQETTLLGYTVPAHTVILPNLWSIMYDEKSFHQPYQFKPERFLDENGVFLQKVDGFAPFGQGKRKCTGEILAKMELFFFACILVHNFRFAKVPDAEYNDLRHSGVIMSPGPFKLNIVS